MTSPSAATAEAVTLQHCWSQVEKRSSLSPKAGGAALALSSVSDGVLGPEE